MYLIKNAEVYAPERLGKQDILVISGRIVQVARDIDVRLEGLEVVDAAGRIAVPGFLDPHVHLIGGGGEGGFHTREAVCGEAESIDLLGLGEKGFHGLGEAVGAQHAHQGGHAAPDGVGDLELRRASPSGPPAGEFFAALQHEDASAGAHEEFYSQKPKIFQTPPTAAHFVLYCTPGGRHGIFLPLKHYHIS